jgi:hypothetical protein
LILSNLSDGWLKGYAERLTLKRIDKIYVGHVAFVHYSLRMAGERDQLEF